jgi:hypothetical protein
MTILYYWPKQAAFMRPVPKSKIYDYAKPSRSVKDRFVSEVDKIIWQYKLAPETINIAAKPAVPEIQVFGVSLKTKMLSDTVLRTIDKAISFPIFYELTFENQVKITAAYKRPSEADSSKWVVGAYFESPWLAVEPPREPLPLALDMEKLYEHMLRPLMPLPPRGIESLKAHAERLENIQSKQKELGKLETRLQREQQFNRKVEINAQLRMLKNELEALSAGQAL